jgi:hypothetical protein
VNPIYVGNCSIEEVPGGRLTYPRGEAAKLTRVFEGDASDVASFLNQYPALSTDYAIPSMVLSDIDVMYEGPQVRCTLTYFGLPGGPSTVPNDYQTNLSWHPRSATLYTDIAADGPYAVNYFAPTITYKYCRENQLDTPIFQDYCRNPNYFTIFDSDSAPSPSFVGPVNPTRKGTFQYDVNPVCTGFERDQKGNIYNYLETWACLLQQAATATSTGSAFTLYEVPAPSVPVGDDGRL